MAERKSRESNRLGRATDVGSVIGKLLDPALRQRGFGNLELFTHWTAIVPAPFDRCTAPDELRWPRGAGEGPVEGAVLYVRVDRAQMLAFAHESERIASAINQYFGFFLVGKVRPAKAAFVAAKPAEPRRAKMPPPDVPQLSSIEDDALKAALRALGSGIAGRD